MTIVFLVCSIPLVVRTARNCTSPTPTICLRARVFDIVFVCLTGADLREPVVRPRVHLCRREARLPQRPDGDPLRFIQPHFGPLGLHLVPEESAAEGLREAEVDGGPG